MKKLVSALLIVIFSMTVFMPAAGAWHYDDFRNCGGHYNNYAHRDTWYAYDWVKSYTHGTTHWHYVFREVWVQDYYGRWYWKKLGYQWYQC